ncbi:MAG: hypothetical protein IKB56_04295, partial [Clostridia bacterium]|nr:hypothetical protein [Clostridia bacterium]
MKRNLTHKILLLILAVALIAALFACSPRSEDDFANDGNVIIGGDDTAIDTNVTKVESTTADKAKKQITEAVENYSTFYQSPDNPEWFVVDLSLEYNFEHFWLDSEEKYNKSSAFTLDLKGNFHLKENAKSELYMQIRNANNLPVVAIYYASGYTYVVVGTQKYYMPELNMTEVGSMLYGTLSGMGVDVNKLFAGIMTGGKTGMPALDDSIGGYLPLIGTILFGTKGQVTYYNQVEEGVYANKDILYALQLETLVESIQSGFDLGTFGLPINLSFSDFWSILGLLGMPAGVDLDPILLQFAGFNFKQLGEKDWPRFDSYWGAITELETVTKTDSDGYTAEEEAYVMKGIRINIATRNDVEEAREKYANTLPGDMEEGDLVEEFAVDIKLKPLLYGSNEKLAINFGGLGLNEQGRKDTYEEGGIGNLGLGLNLYFENDENGGLTINRVLGEAFDIDLGALGDMPIDLPYAARYELGLDVKLALDFIDGAKTQAEITINFNDTPLMRLFLNDCDLYINFEELKVYSGQMLPNVVLKGFDINSLLSGVLSGLAPYLDPNYVRPSTPVNVQNNSLLGGLFNEGEGTTEGGGSSIDVMALVGIILMNIEVPGIEEYLYNEDGTVQTDANGNPIPNHWNIELDLNNEELSDIVGMITPLAGDLGDELNVNLHFNQKNPLDTFGLVVDVSDTFRLGIGLDTLTYMKEPDWQNYEMIDTAEERNKYVNLSIYKTENGEFLYANRSYNAVIQGDVSLGANQTSEEGLDLSGLIGAFLDNVLLSVGVKYTGSTTIAYKVVANIDIIDMAQTELRVTIYNKATEEPFIRVLYLGVEDTLYIDLECLENMGFASLGKLPRLKYENMGLRDTLAGLDIASIVAGLLVSEETGAQNSITIDTSDPNFLNNVKLGFYQYLVMNEYIATGVLIGGEEIGTALFSALNEGEGTDGEGTGGEGTEGETSEGGGLDIMQILGMALRNVEIDAIKSTITVYVASGVLSSLLTMLLAPVDEFGNPVTITMPDVNAFVQIKAKDFDFGTDENGKNTIYPENGYVRVYFGIVEGDKEIDAIWLELDILKDIAIRAGKENIRDDIEETDYFGSFKSIPEFLDELTIGLRLEGHFDLTVDETPVYEIDEEGNYVLDENGEKIPVLDEDGNQVMQTIEKYTNAYLNQMLSGLIDGLGLMVDTSRLDIELGFEIVGKITLGGVIKLDGSEASDPINTILSGSELQIRLFDRKVPGEEGDILGIYLLNGNLYLDLSFFNMPSIGINDVARLIDDIGTLTGSTEADKDEAPANLLHLNRVAEFADASNPEAVALQVVLDYDKVAINLTKDAIASLVSLLLGSSLPVEIQDTALEIGLNNTGVFLEISTGVEIFNLDLGLSRFKIALDGEELKGSEFLVSLPNEDFYLTEEGLPTNVYLELGGYAYINSEVVANSDKNVIDLSPALSGLLGDIELNMLIEFLGLVDEALFFELDANLNLAEIISLLNEGLDVAKLQQTGIAITLSTYASADPTDENYYDEDGNRALRHVMEIYYVDGDLYAHIDTFIAELQYIFVPGANELIAGLLGSMLGGDPTEENHAYNNEDAPAEVNEVKFYIDLLLADYGLSVNITKGFLIGVFNVLGLNVEEYLKSLDLEVEVGLNASPLEVALALKLRDVGLDGEDAPGTANPNDGNFVTLGASINKLTILMDKRVALSDEEKGKYDTITELATIGVNLGGIAKLELSSPGGVIDPETGAEGNLTSLTNILTELQTILGQNAEKEKLYWIREAALKPEYAGLDDDELANIYHEEVRSNINYQALLNFGLIIDVIADVVDGKATAGGTIYYDIEVILDISNISNLKASIFLSTSPKLENRGDIMWVSIMGEEVNAETGEIDLNVIADLTKVFGDVLEINDVIRVNNFGAFTEYMEQFSEIMTGKEEETNPVALNSTNNGLVLPRNAEGKVAPSIMTASAIILAISADPDSFGIPNSAPVAIVAPAAAIYSLVGSLLSTDQEFEVAVDTDKITTYANTGVYSAQEYYYALHGLTEQYRTAIAKHYADGVLSVSDYNSIDMVWKNFITTLNDNYAKGEMTIQEMDTLFLSFIAQYKDMIGENVGRYFPNISEEAIVLITADLTAVETLYASISALDGEYSEEQYNNLKNGLVALRKAELDKMHAEGKLTDKDYEYLYYGIIRDLDGEVVNPADYGAIDLKKFFGIHDPSLLIELGAGKIPDEYEESGYRSAFLLANISLAELLEVQLEIGAIQVSVSPDETYYTGVIDEYGTWQGGLLNPKNNYHWFNPDEMAEQNITISFSGKTKLSAKDTTPETAIDFKELLEAFFTEVNFGAIIQNYGLEDSEITIDLSLNLNMHDVMLFIATNDINWILVRAELLLRVGVDVTRQVIDVALTEQTGTTQMVSVTTKEYISLYYKDGCAYIDGRMLGVQRLKVEMFLDHIMRLIGNDGLEDYFEKESEDDDEIYEGDEKVENASASVSELRASGQMSDEEYLARYAEDEEIDESDLLPYVRLVFGNGSGFILDIMGAVVFAILGGLDLGIDGIDDLGGLVSDIVNDNFALQLGLIANLAFMNDFWSNSDDEGIVAENDEKALLALTLEIANYTVGFALMGLDVDLRDASDEMGDVNVAPDGFDEDNYAEASSLESVYVEFAVDFDIDGDDGAKFNLDETISGALGLLGSGGIMDTIGGLGLAPIIQLLSNVTTHYRLEIIGNINFGEIIENMTFYKTNFAVILRDRNKTVNYDGEEKFKEVLSIYYVDRCAYLNAECFNLQAVKIEDFWNFLTQDVLPAFGVEHVEGGKDPNYGQEEEEEVKNLGFAGYESNFDPFAILNLAKNIPQGATLVPGYVNVLLCPEGLIINITTAALFGILRAVGGEAMDFSSYVEPIGELIIELGIAGPDHMLALDLTFQGYQFAGDERVDQSTDPNVHDYLLGGKINLSLGVSNNFTAALSYGWTEDTYYLEKDGTIRIESAYVDHAIKAPQYAYIDQEVVDEKTGEVVQEYTTQDYVNFDHTNPVVSFGLNLYFDLGSEAITGEGIFGVLTDKVYTGYDLNKEPLTSLLASVLAGMLDSTLGILLEVVGEHQISLAVEILVNLPLLNYRGIEVQLTVRRVDGNHDYKLVQVNLHNSNLYVDLTYLNGPKFSVEEVLESLLGEKDIDLGFGGGSTEEKEEVEVQNAGTNANGGPYTPINIDLGAPMLIRDIATHGLALYLTETAINSVLGIVPLPALKVFSDVLIQISVAPRANSFNFGIDLELSATSMSETTMETSKVLDLGLALGDHDLNFEAYPSTQLILPQTANYLPAHDVNTIELEAGFEIKFKIDDGIVDLGHLYETILDINGPFGGIAKGTAFEYLFSKDSPLATALPNLIMLGFLKGDEESFGDTIRIDILAKAFIKGGLDGLLNKLQLKVEIYSLKDKERFYISIALFDGDLYLDLSTIGLGKIEIWELMGMFEYIMNGGNTEEEEGGDENVANAITPEVEATFAETYPTWGQVLGLHNEGDEEQLIGIVKVLLSQDDGLLLTVTFEMINVLLTLVGLEIDLQDYLSGVLEPSAGIGMTPNSEYHVDINLDTGKDYRDHWVIDPATGEYVLGRYLVDKEGNFVYDENGNHIFGIYEYDENGEYLLDEDGNRVINTTNNQDYNADAGISFGISILGQNIKADVQNESEIYTPYGKESTLVPVISKEERSSYTRYDEMAFQIGTNISLQLDFEDGDVSLVDLLDVVFSMFNMKLPEDLDTSIVLAGGDETLYMEINLKAGLDLKRMLSSDPEVFGSALIVDLVIRYTIIDNATGDVYDTQKLIQVYMVDNVAYLGLEIFDTNLDIKLDEFDITGFVRDMMDDFFDMADVDQGVDSGSGNEAQNAPSTAPDGPARNPIIDMYQESDYAIGNFLKPIIYLNSEGFGLMVTKELIIGVGDALIEILTGLLGAADSDVDITTEHIEGIAELLLDYASVGLFFKEGTGGMSLQINITKQSAEIETPDGNKYMSAGYGATLSLLHDSVALINTEAFDEYLDFMRNDEEMREFKEGCFSTGNLEWRLNLGIDITVSADIREYILNWSSLFQNEADVDGNVVGAAFYIQALNDIMGDATLRIKADVALKDLDKWGIDAIIQLVKLKEPGTYEEGESDVEEEYFSLYVLGSMHRDAQSYEESRLGLYLTMDAFEGLGINGIELNHQVFEEFLSLNLNAVLDSLGGTLSNTAGGIVNTLDGLIESLYDMLGDEDKMKDEENTEGEEGSENNQVQNAGEEGEQDDNIYDYEDEEVEEGSGMWYIGLLDSIQFTKGAISIVVAQTAIQTLLKETVGFPFDEKIGNLSITLDNTANALSLNLGLDYQEPIDVTKTEIENLNTTIAKQESVEAIKNALGTASTALDGVLVTFNSIDSSVFASEGYYGSPENSEANGVVPVGSSVGVGYLVFDVYDVYGLDRNVVYGAEELKQRALRIRTALVNSFKNKESFVENNDLTNDISILTNEITKTRIAIKLSESKVLLAYVTNVTNIPELRIAEIECSFLGDKLVSVVSEQDALKEIRTTYESNFLVNATVATEDGDKALIAEKSYLQQQVITEDKAFPLENSGTRNVFYFVFNPAEYFTIDSGFIPGSVNYLNASKANAERVIESISQHLQKHTYVWSQNAQGVHTFHHYAAMLNVSVKVAEIKNEFGAITEYKVLMAVSSTKSMYNVGLKIHGIDIGLGQTNIFAETPLGTMMREDYLGYFEENFKPLSEYEMEAEISFEFRIDDTVGGLFDMSELLGTVGGLLGPGIGEMISQIN